MLVFETSSTIPFCTVGSLPTFFMEEPVTSYFVTLWFPVLPTVIHWWLLLSIGLQSQPRPGLTTLPDLTQASSTVMAVKEYSHE